MKAPQKSLKKWTKQKWRTKSGKKSADTGERYLPEKAIKSLSSAEYSATTEAKRKGTAEGKQFVKQPKKIADKVKKFRASEGGLTMMNKPPKFKLCPDCPTPTECTAAGKCLKKNQGPKVGMSKGGTAKKMGYAKGGTVKKMGRAKDGMDNCGASVRPNGKSRK